MHGECLKIRFVAKSVFNDVVKFIFDSDDTFNQWTMCKTAIQHVLTNY